VELCVPDDNSPVDDAASPALNNSSKEGISLGPPAWPYRCRGGMFTLPESSSTLLPHWCAAATRRTSLTRELTGDLSSGKYVRQWARQNNKVCPFRARPWGWATTVNETRQARPQAIRRRNLDRNEDDAGRLRRNEGTRWRR
jgi:hypothetical protein